MVQISVKTNHYFLLSRYLFNKSIPLINSHRFFNKYKCFYTKNFKCFGCKLCGDPIKTASDLIISFNLS